MKQPRLDKYLADAGIGSRSQVKEYIRKKMITINGNFPADGAVKIRPEQDVICYQGRPVIREVFVYYMLNKPAGYVSATKDSSCPTVLSLIQDSTHKDLFPVGRLDKDTEGLLLITNDGAMAHRLLSPGYHVNKTYYVEVSRYHTIPPDAVSRFQVGVDIGEKHFTLPAALELLSPTSAYITIQEGKYHQVKRMFHAIGCEVIYLKRIAFASLKLEESLSSGESRPLRTEELQALKNLVRMGEK